MAEDADVVSKENQNEPSQAKSELEVLKEQILQAQESGRRAPRVSEAVQGGSR